MAAELGSTRFKASVITAFFSGAVLSLLVVTIPHSPRRHMTLQGAKLGTKSHQPDSTLTDARTTHVQTQQAVPGRPSWWPDEAATIITNTTLPQIMQWAATQQENAVIFNAFTAPNETNGLDMLRNMCFHLQQQGMLQHTLLITSDEGSWKRARQSGLPAYLDRASPVQDRAHAFTYQKHWYAARIVELGHSLIFLDTDVVVLGDVMQPLHTEWDLQGLSDWQTGPNLPSTGSANVLSCGPYAVVRDERIKTRELGAVLMFKGHVNLSSALDVPVPCQSTGLWYVRPTMQTVRFLNKHSARINWAASWQWDQAAWNELLPAYLWGMGEEPPIRYRLLPVEQFSNLGVYRERIALSMPTQPVVLHEGYVHGPDKVRSFKELGLWKAPDYVLLSVKSV